MMWRAYWELGINWEIFELLDLNSRIAETASSVIKIGSAMSNTELIVKVSQ